MKFKEKIARFMAGRYGNDNFARFLLVAAIFLIILSSLAKGTLLGLFFWILAIAALVYCYWRMLSRNSYKRSRENVWYLQKKNAFLRWFRSVKERWQQRREYKFFRCPGCRTLLRVPKGKGKIILTCRKCGHRFERKS